MRLQINIKLKGKHSVFICYWQILKDERMFWKCKAYMKNSQLYYCYYDWKSQQWKEYLYLCNWQRRSRCYGICSLLRGAFILQIFADLTFSNKIDLIWDIFTILFANIEEQYISCYIIVIPSIIFVLLF